MVVASASFAQESATVLPQKIVRGRVVTIFAPGVTEQYNNNGTKESLVAAYNGKQINLADAAPALAGALTTYGAGAVVPLLNSTFSASANINVQQYITAFEYGLTPKLSLGVIVPVVKFESNASVTASNGYAQAQAAIDSSALNGSDVETGMTEYMRQTTLSGLGYSEPGKTNFTALGDIELGGKYQFYKTEKLLMSWQAGTRMPTTTHTATQANLFDRDIADGQWDLAAQWMGDYFLNSNLFVSGSAKLTWQLADKVDRYVRANKSDLLPDLTNTSLRDSNISRDLGEVFDGEVSANYQFGDKQFKTWGIYQYQAQAQDVYRGTKNLSYSSLETGTNSISHRVVAGFGFTTIPMFQKKQFAIPMDFKLSYSFPVAGKNVSNSKYSRMDVVAYF